MSKQKDREYTNEELLKILGTRRGKAKSTPSEEKAAREEELERRLASTREEMEREWASKREEVERELASEREKMEREWASRREEIERKLASEREEMERELASEQKMAKLQEAYEETKRKIEEDYEETKARLLEMLKEECEKMSESPSEAPSEAPQPSEIYPDDAELLGKLKHFGSWINAKGHLGLGRLAVSNERMRRYDAEVEKVDDSTIRIYFDCASVNVTPYAIDYIAYMVNKESSSTIFLDTDFVGMGVLSLRYNLVAKLDRTLGLREATEMVIRNIFRSYNKTPSVYIPNGMFDDEK